MRNVEIAIVGSGLAGSTAAAMLGRSGFDVVAVDPACVYPPDFRCEKLDGPQLRLLEKTGLAGAVLRAATHDGEARVARFGHLVQRRPGDQHGIRYDALVNTIRAEIPANVGIVHAKAASITTGEDRQLLKLSNGEEISARLVVLATGLNNSLRESLGIHRIDISPCHSVMAGFDLAPVGRRSFDFGSLTYYGEKPADRTAYITLFPAGAACRANLCFYRDMRDPWVRGFREAPRETLTALMPSLRKFTGPFDISGPVEIRPADLYVTTGHRQAGIALVGDAFATSCPAAGTGARKVFTDVERLCNVYIPRWLATAGMGGEKIAGFYDDPDKTACDRFSHDKAYSLRAMTTNTSLSWRAWRALRFVAQLGLEPLRNRYRQRIQRTRHAAPLTVR